jgi:prepilin-type processing-associated H-X9-DG protein
LKQIGLAITMYAEDNDEYQPTGVDNGCQYNPATSCGNEGPSFAWPGKIAPYVKTIGIFGCPDDPSALANDSAHGWRGPDISYGANCAIAAHWMFNWVPNQGGGNAVVGALGIGNAGSQFGAAFGGQVKLSQIGEPSNSIEIFEQYNSDMQKFFSGQVLGGANTCGGTNYNECGNVAGADDGMVNTGLTWEFAGRAFPGSCGQIFGNVVPCNTAAPNEFGDGIVPGGASVHHTSGTVSNYLFVDSHVKAMKPSATGGSDVVGTPGSPDNGAANMWYALRP